MCFTYTKIYLYMCIYICVYLCVCVYICTQLAVLKIFLPLTLETYTPSLEQKENN